MIASSILPWPLTLPLSKARSSLFLLQIGGNTLVSTLGSNHSVKVFTHHTCKWKEKKIICEADLSNRWTSCAVNVPIKLGWFCVFTERKWWRAKKKTLQAGHYKHLKKLWKEVRALGTFRHFSCCSFTRWGGLQPPPPRGSVSAARMYFWQMCDHSQEEVGSFRVVSLISISLNRWKVGHKKKKRFPFSSLFTEFLSCLFLHSPPSFVSPQFWSGVGGCRGDEDKVLSSSVCGVVASRRRWSSSRLVVIQQNQDNRYSIIKHHCQLITLG